MGGPDRDFWLMLLNNLAHLLLFIELKWISLRSA